MQMAACTCFSKSVAFSLKCGDVSNITWFRLICSIIVLFWQLRPCSTRYKSVTGSVPTLINKSLDVFIVHATKDNYTLSSICIIRQTSMTTLLLLCTGCQAAKQYVPFSQWFWLDQVRTRFEPVTSCSPSRHSTTTPLEPVNIINVDVWSI